MDWYQTIKSYLHWKNCEYSSVESKKTKIDLEDRVRFESLISELSARFVNIAPDQVDSAIDVALFEILNFLKVDRIGLLQYEKNSDSYRHIHVACADQISPVPVAVDLPVSLFPYMYQKVLLEGKVTSFTTRDNLPEKAAIDRQTYADWEIRSCLNIPIDIGNEFMYVVVITSVRKECVWPEIHIPRLQLLGQIFANVLELKRTRRQLENRVMFEELLSQISANFVKITRKQLDVAIENALGRIVEFLDLDRSVIARFSQENPRMINTHFSTVPGVQVAWSELNNEKIPWVIEEITRGKAVVFSCIEDLPVEALKDKEFFEKIGIKSNVTLPLVAGRNVLGFFGCSVLRTERTWQKEVIQGLQLLADVFTNAIVRKQKEAQLKEKFNEIRNLKRQLEKDNIYLREKINLQHAHEQIVGKSEVMMYVLSQVEQVAKTDSTVLIQGETGTGKELIASAIHNLSMRKDRPLITVNCACLPPSLMESELFGREKGAYTSALTRMSGRFEMANDSTIFLDEIGELPKEIQSKLLRVLETGTIERLGSANTVYVNVRIIAATNRILEKEVKEGTFRNDLYYRLNVFPISVPPLRERAEDIPQLVWALVRQLEQKIGKRIDSVSGKSMEDLQRYSWPGNVRELRNIIEYAMIVNKGSKLTISTPFNSTIIKKSPNQNLEDMERRHIINVLEQTGWRISGTGGASEILGLKRTTLQSKIKKLRIKRS